jgi:RNA polymerase-interacting CarD/CdnL/TRCF family regulator
MTTQQKKPSQRQGFKTGESIVYPAHGVGQIVAIEEQEVAGHKLELFVIDFEKDKMRLKVPVAKASTIGMRKFPKQISSSARSRSFRAVPGSSGPCGRAVRRNMMRRSTPAI